MANDRFNEGADMTVTVAFLNAAGAPVTPDSARYRIDDVSSGDNIVPATALSALSTTKDIPITAAQNAILTGWEWQAWATRVVTVDFVYATTKHGVAKYEYDLINLRFAPVG